MTTKERLLLVEFLLDSDVAHEADYSLLDEHFPKKERAFAELLMRLYRLVHCHSSKHHPDWDIENEELLTHFKAENKLKK